MVQPEPLSVDDALDRLVNQFSDSMAFFRELIQNAIDAGSEEVEIDFERRDGTMVVHVDDWGAGMNREIIDSRLTRLFSSGKDGDRTKIGKFGIGFVSVFAIEPQAVCIDTSRDGEHWRVVFDEQRQFSLVRRDQPTEGTKIQVFKALSEAEFNRFRARARDVIRYWCRHVEVEIRVEGKAVNEAFELQMPTQVEQERDGEHIVVGHPPEGKSFSGFYNRGLTLVEEQHIEGIAFKASSAKLEHTLTRDDVVRDRGFTRLMNTIEQLIANQLSAEVFAQLADEIAKRDPDQAIPRSEQTQLEYLWGAARWHVEAESNIDPDTVVAISPAGQPLTLAKLRKPKRGRVVLARRPNPVSALMEAEGATVVWLPTKCVKGRALIETLAPEVATLESWVTALPPTDSEEAQRWQILAAGVARLLDDWGAKLAGVRLGHLDYPYSPVVDRVAITQKVFGDATPLDEVGELGMRLLASRRVVVLNADHPALRTIAELAQTEPELAAYFAVKAFFLGERLDAATDEKLALITSDFRLERTGAEG